MQQDLNRVIEQVSKEKGIDKTILVSALENAMVSAAKKKFGHQRKIEAQFNPEIGEVELFEAKTVVEQVQDEATEITLSEARDTLDPDAQIGDDPGADQPIANAERLRFDVGNQDIRHQQAMLDEIEVAAIRNARRTGLGAPPVVEPPDQLGLSQFRVGPDRQEHPQVEGAFWANSYRKATLA